MYINGRMDSSVSEATELHTNYLCDGWSLLFGMSYKLDL